MSLSNLSQPTKPSKLDPTPQEKIRRVRAFLSTPLSGVELTSLIEGSWVTLAEQAGAIVEVDGQYYRCENVPLVFSAGETPTSYTVVAPEFIPTLTSEDKALAAKNTCELHARIAQEAREDLAELEAAGIESPKPTFPELPDLKLVNADRVWQDGYLLYVGNRSACVLAAEWFAGAGVKKNSDDGRSWRLMITIGQLEQSRQVFDSTITTTNYDQKQASTQQQVA